MKAFILTVFADGTPELELELELNKVLSSNDGAIEIHTLTRDLYVDLDSLKVVDL